MLQTKSPPLEGGVPQGQGESPAPQPSEAVSARKGRTDEIMQTSAQARMSAIPASEDAGKVARSA